MNIAFETNPVDACVAEARSAQRDFEAKGSQARYDRAALAAGWAIMEPARNEALARLAVEATGLGNVADKTLKNHRKTLGLLRDIKDARTFGVIGEARGVTEVARAKGIVGAVTPSTNPVATPANNIVNALKCGNAIVLSPSPKGEACCAALIGHVHAEFAKIGEDPALVQMVPPPGSKDRTQRLLELCDMAVVTGSQDNVRRAYMSGTPAIGVGAGNVAVIVDESADPAAAAAKVAASKTFDNATSCSSENALIVVEAAWDAFVAALASEGGAVLPREAAAEVTARLFRGGKLNREVIARDPEVVIKRLGLSSRVPQGTRFVCVETKGVGPEHPLSGEKLSVVAALYRVPDFEAAEALAARLMAHQGAGHSVGLHSTDEDRALGLARRLPTARVIVNQAHCFATGGSFENGLPFSLSMGCGTWGGNTIDDNLHWRHFMQTAKVVRPIPPEEPALEDIFGAYWTEAGR